MVRGDAYPHVCCVRTSMRYGVQSGGRGTFGRRYWAYPVAWRTITQELILWGGSWPICYDL